MLVVQYQMLWNGSTREPWRDLAEIDIPASGSASITMPAFGQSDRLKNASGSNIYGANALIQCVLNGTFTRDSSNVIRIVGGTLSNYKFIYDSSAWGHQIGAPVYAGTYDFYAINSDGVESFIYQYAGGDTVVDDYQLDVPGKTTKAEYNETIQPGGQFSNEHYYGRCYNEVQGSNNNLQVFLRFKNTYPADYRPGEVRVDGTWKSTNRTGGKCHIRQNGQWVEMRTLNGGTGTDNPPSLRKDGVWKNQYKIGSE